MLNIYLSVFDFACFPPKIPSQILINYYQSARNFAKYSAARRRRWHFPSIIVYRVSCRRADYRLLYCSRGITSHVINLPSALKLTRCVSSFFTVYNTARYVPYDKSILHFTW